MSFCNLCDKHFKKIGYADSDRHTKSKMHLKAMEKTPKNEVKVSSEPIQEQQPQLINLISQKNADLDIKDTGNMVSTINEMKTNITEIEVDEPIYKADNIFPENKIINSCPHSNSQTKAVDDLECSDSDDEPEIPKVPLNPIGKMFQSMQEKNHTIPAKYLNSNFISFANQSDFMDEITENTDPRYYEILQAGKPQRMFADIDGDLPLNGMDLNAIVNTFQRLVTAGFSFLNLEYNPARSRWTTASTSTKLSIHWVYLDYVFQNCDIQKRFWEYMLKIQHAKYPELDKYIATNNGDSHSLSSVIDTVVYSKNRAMRTIYSTKDGTRPLIPFDFTDNRITLLTETDDDLNYLIYQPHESEFFNLELPEIGNKERIKYDRKTVETIIHDNIENVEIMSYNPPLIGLRTVGLRTCIINGEENRSDNCYVVMKHDGLYFGCHDEGCAGQHKRISKRNQSPDIEFDTFSDYKKLMALSRKLDTIGQVVPYDTIIKYFNSTISCIIDGGAPIYITKNRITNTYGDGSTYFTYEFKSLKSLPILKQRKVKVISTDNKKTNTVYKSLHDIYNNIISTTPDVLLEYERKQFMPYLYDKPFESKNGEVFNWFKGFHMLQFERPEINTFEQSCAYKHIYNDLCNGNDEVATYLLNWIAHMIQKPYERAKTNILLYSGQGTGKGWFNSLIKNIIGEQYSGYYDNLTDYTNKFNSQQNGVLFTFLDEIGDTSKTAARSNVHEILKSRTDNDTIRIEPKGFEAFTVNNYTRNVFATNFRNNLRIENDDRRYVCLQVSEVHKNNSEYFKPLWEYVDNKDCLIDAFYYFAHRDISNFVPHGTGNVPITDFKIEQKLQNEPVIEFLCDVYNCEYNIQGYRDIVVTMEDNTIKVLKIKVKTLYHIYERWCESNGTRNKLSLKFFKERLKKYGIKTRQSYKEGMKEDGRNIIAKGINTSYTELEQLIGIYLKYPKFKVAGVF